MGNDRFLIGMFVACCLVLLVGIAFTWVEIAGYLGAPAAAAEPRAPAEAAPAEEEEEEAEEAAPAAPVETGSVLDLAPAGAVAALVVDGKKLAASGIWEKLRELGEGAPEARFPIEPEQLEEAAVFVGVDETDLEKEPEFSGIVLHRGPAADLRSALEQRSMGTETVAGLEAYQAEGALVAVADDGTILFGSTSGSLASLVRARQSGAGALSASLANAVQSYSRLPVRFGASLSEALRAKIAERGGPTTPAGPFAAPGPMPSQMAEITRVAGGVDITREALSPEVSVTFENAERARQAAADANSSLSQAKAQISQMIEQMKGAGEQAAVMVQSFQFALDVVESIKILAGGPELRLSARVDLEQLGQAVEAILPMMMMQAMGGMEGMEQTLP